MTSRANGEGYLYNRFMRGWVDARQQEINGVHEKYGKKSWVYLFNIMCELPLKVSERAENGGWDSCSCALVSTFAGMKTKAILTTCRDALLGACALLLTACDIIDYHPYDTRTSGPHHLNASNIQRIEELYAGRDSVRFVLISDTQRWYDETREAVKSINARGDIDFVLHCGDISDFGVTREFELQRDILCKLNVPFVVLLGNHDCLGTGENVFQWIFGEPNFSFNVGDTHFLCINTNAFEYDYSTAVPDFAFIKNDRTTLPEGIRRTVVAMHAQPTSEQFNNNVAGLFEWEIHKFPSLEFCLCGHGHKTQANDLFDDGTLYYECGAAKKREYLVFTLHAKGGYSHEVVQY